MNMKTRAICLPRACCAGAAAQPAGARASAAGAGASRPRPSRRPAGDRGAERARRHRRLAGAAIIRSPSAIGARSPTAAMPTPNIISPRPISSAAACRRIRPSPSNGIERAARQGHREAQANYGLLLFQNGRRARGDAVDRAGRQSRRPARAICLGTALFNGDLVPRDLPRAYALMSRAAATGLPPAVSQLAAMEPPITAEDRARGDAARRRACRQPHGGRRQVASAPPPHPPVRTQPTAPTPHAGTRAARRAAPSATPAAASRASREAPTPRVRSERAARLRHRPAPRRRCRRPLAGPARRVQQRSQCAHAWARLSPAAWPAPGPSSSMPARLRGSRPGPLASRAAAVARLRARRQSAAFPVAP